MSRLAIHINDAGITVSNGDKITYREPGYAYLGTDDTDDRRCRLFRMHESIRVGSSTGSGLN